MSEQPTLPKNTRKFSVPKMDTMSDPRPIAKTHTPSVPDSRPVERAFSPSATPTSNPAQSYSAAPVSRPVERTYIPDPRPVERTYASNPQSGNESAPVFADRTARVHAPISGGTSVGVTVPKKNGKLIAIIIAAVAALLLAGGLILFFVLKDKRSDGTSSGGSKKDQVVHEGETAQYGDLTFRFEKQGVAYSENWYVAIHVFCENHGEQQVDLYESSFKPYADGTPCDTVSLFTDPMDWDYNNAVEKQLATYGKQPYSLRDNSTSIELTSGRSGDLWIVAKIPANSKTVEFDYTNGRYSKTWGKLTFAVDVPQSYQPSDNSLIGTWIYIMSKNITVTYIFNSDGTGFYNWVNGTYESPYTFT